MPSAENELLVCQFSPGQIFEGTTNGLTIVRSAVACMDAALSKAFKGVLIYFSVRQIRLRELLIELCADLNRNPQKRSIPTCVSLEYPHRLLLAKLSEAGTEYADIRPPTEAANPWKIWERTVVQGANMRIESQLSRLCPFLHYKPINDQNELITCAAYRNRMVLGGRRLHEVCQTETYLHCEYYLNPRVAA